MNLLTAKKLVEFFNDFVIDEKTKVLSIPGFYKYLVLVKKFDPVMLRDVKDRFKEDPEVYGYVKSVCEGDLVEQGLLGLVHNSMSQFVLKHKHGYIDKLEIEETNKNNEIIVTFK